MILKEWACYKKAHQPHMEWTICVNMVVVGINCKSKITMNKNFLSGNISNMILRTNSWSIFTEKEILISKINTNYIPLKIPNQM